MKIELEYAKNPEATASGINLVCKFTHLDFEVPFHATADDVAEHGRAIYASALAGEYGAVAPYLAPSAQEIAMQEAPRKRQEYMDTAVRQVKHCEMVDAPDKAASWKAYYKQLYTLPFTEGWPLVEWPVAPEDAHVFS